MTAIYIPRVSISESQQTIINKLSCLGVITRVDFTPIGKQVGFVESYDSKDIYKSVFIHFSELFQSSAEIDVLYWKQNNTYLGILDDIFVSKNRVEFYPYANEDTHDESRKNMYWILLKADNPIQSTMMNTSQIVENCRHLESTVHDLKSKVAELTNVIQNQVQIITTLSTHTQDMYLFINYIRSHLQESPESQEFLEDEENQENEEDNYANFQNYFNNLQEYNESCALEEISNDDTEDANTEETNYDDLPELIEITNEEETITNTDTTVNSYLDRVDCTTNYCGNN
jgi:hypothetical protein